MDQLTTHPMRTGRRRPVVTRSLTAGLIGVLLSGAAGCGGDGSGGPRWSPGPSAGPSSSAPAPVADSVNTVSLSATGDIIMGDAPERLPADGGRGFFDGVRSAVAADLVMGNLEEPLTEDTGTGKCPPTSTNCHQFRAPSEYAVHLRDAGFHLLNQANNHGNDFGPAGYRNTQRALERYGLRHTGAPDEITVVAVKGVKVAVVGFSSYAWNNSLTDIDSARRVVRKAASMAELVVVQVHMGAEGADRTRVKPGTELFLGENRGDPVRFSHAMIDEGADLIVGHGPHVLRGMEFHRGRLIAYSLGNFAGGSGTLNNSGRLGLGGILKVSLTKDGTWSGGRFVSSYMNGAGRPTTDARGRGLALVQQLCDSDFPTTGARLTATGGISPPTAG